MKISSISKNWSAKRILLPYCILFQVLTVAVQAQTGGIRIDNPAQQTLTEIDLPDTLLPGRKTLIVFYALPNGNSIEWTRGKKMAAGDDWHFDIQHIGAQTRYLRNVMTGHNLIVVYMANYLKSWPAWKRQSPGRPAEIKRLADSITRAYARFRPEVMLNSHSGGGSWIFGYLDASEKIPANITRIGFIDSDYGYEDSLHTGKLAAWLAGKKHFLTVLAYNDSVVIYNGKPLVSPTGGTWYRTRLMQQKLAGYFRFRMVADTAFINYKSLSDRIDIRLKTNPEGKIYHTEQVARNGFIHTVIGGTGYEKKSGYTYWGERIYGRWL